MLTPRRILETLFPHLQAAAAYARQIQPQIRALPAKEQGENFFAAALTDADLSIQTLVEVALLANFPNLCFYGEERDRSSNTKYFPPLDFTNPGDYLVTLDPIDGTQFYLDGHKNYQIILSILNPDDFEAVLAISPGQDCFYYALRGEGMQKGSLAGGLETSRPFSVTQPKPAIFLGWGMSALAPLLRGQYQIFAVETSYAREIEIPNFNGILSGDLAGAVLNSGNLIDGAALTFLAREAGCIATTLDGSPLPPLQACQNYNLPGLIVASSTSVYHHLLGAVQQHRDGVQTRKERGNVGD